MISVHLQPAIDEIKSPLFYLPEQGARSSNEANVLVLILW